MIINLIEILKPLTQKWLFRYSGRTQKQMQEHVRENFVKRQSFQRQVFSLAMSIFLGNPSKASILFGNEESGSVVHAAIFQSLKGNLINPELLSSRY